MVFLLLHYIMKKPTIFNSKGPYGIIPLYLGWDKNHVLYIASELKALGEGICEKIQLFPRGHCLTDKHQNPIKWYNLKMG